MASELPSAVFRHEATETAEPSSTVHRMVPSEQNQRGTKLLLQSRCPHGYQGGQSIGHGDDTDQLFESLNQGGGGGVRAKGHAQ